MEALLLLPLCILTGAHCQNWDVTLPRGPLVGPIGSCMTIPCSYTYPKKQRVTRVAWSRGEERIVEFAEVSVRGYTAANRVQFLGDLKDNCTLHFSKLALGDGGAYYFEVQSHNQKWRNPQALCLTVSEQHCRVHISLHSTGGAHLSDRFSCSIPEHCASGLYWANSSGVRIPGQHVSSEHSSQLRVDVIWQYRGAVLECRMQGYQDRSIPKESWPPATGRSPLLKVLVDADSSFPIREGDSFTLRCVEDSGSPDQFYYWVHNNNGLRETGGFSVRIEGATSSQGGNYTCMRWAFGPVHAYLAISPTTYVAILATPLVHVVATPGPQRTSGDPLSLMCRLNSSAYAEVGFSWFKDGERLECVQPELPFLGVQVEDAGEYHCEVHNSLGKSTSLPLTVTVVYGSDWYQLSPRLMASFGAGVLLLLLLSNVGVYCLTRRISPGDEPQMSVQGGSKEDPSVPQRDSLYEEIPCTPGDISYSSDKDGSYCNSTSEDYNN